MTALRAPLHSMEGLLTLTCLTPVLLQACPASLSSSHAMSSPSAAIWETSATHA